MTISTEQIKELREKTGAGISDIKKALEDYGGDIDAAKRALERKLGSLAGRREGRDTKAGLVESYIHSNGRIGSMVELFCETDFVARSPVFKELAHDLAMHVAAMRPLYLSLEGVPQDLWGAEKNRFEEDIRQLGKPSHIVQEIVEGKLKSHFGAMCFFEQPFVKDQDKTVGEVVKESVGRFGENIKIGRFVRFEI